MCRAGGRNDRRAQVSLQAEFYARGPAAAPLAPLGASGADATRLLSFSPRADNAVSRRREGRPTGSTRTGRHCVRRGGRRCRPAGPVVAAGSLAAAGLSSPWKGLDDVTHSPGSPRWP
ncbi:Hypothetical predicted protein [Marmota monax]|uniref:Uncharacterized protein n=1 Tax=Marmota monax TaxID=9995 RepID=A0A5E4BXU5_MARMO|nr:hypothetical protein GHT09_007755 [Marmota monax]VTJ73800.1 Hypothetical predicted protein [Marmota monax]